MRPSIAIGEPVTFNEHRAIFRPRDSHDLRVIDARLTLSPPGNVRWIHDVFSNSIALITFERAAEELRFASQIEIEHYGLHEPAFPIRSYAATYPFRYDNDQVVDLLPTLQCHYPDPEGAVSAWARQFVDPGGVDTQELLVRITRAIKAQFAYRPRAIHGTQAPTETLALGSGTCRDFALLMIEAVRSLGMAARFVTGYLYDPSMDEAGRDAGAGPERPGRLGRDPRLGPGLSAGRRLGRVRPDQRPGRRRPSDPGRGRARSTPGAAALRLLPRLRQRLHRDAGRRPGDRRHAALSPLCSRTAICPRLGAWLHVPTSCA